MRKIKILTTGLISLVLCVLVIISSTGSFSVANSILGRCPEAFDGLVVNPKPLDLSDAINPNEGSRKYTIQELFANTIDYTVFYGNTNSSDGGIISNLVLAEKDSGVSGDKVDELGHDVSHCLFATPTKKTAPGFLIDLSATAVDLIRMITTPVFSQSWICSDPNDPDKDAPCVNLLGIVGGSRDEEGLLSILNEGLFFPIIAFAIAIAALYIAWYGIGKKQYRRSLGMVFWVIVVIFVALLIRHFPKQITSMPYQINNIVSSCTLGALSGENCFTGERNDNAVSPFVGVECQSNSNTARGFKHTEYLVNGVNCAIWKSFVLEPWTKGQFGVTYNALDDYPGVDNLPVYLENSKSPNELNGLYYYDAGFGGGESVNNLALSWLSLMAGGGSREKLNDSSVKPVVPDEAVELVQAIVDDDALWGPFVGATPRWQDAIVGFIGALVLLYSLFRMAFFAHAYYFLATFLIVFAPIFMLFAVVPNRGKKMFLGWLENLINYILKYAVTVIMLLLAMIFYSAILEVLSGFMSVVAMVIVAFAFSTYRKEIVDLFSKVSFGGTRMSNALRDKILEDAATVAMPAAAGAGHVWGNVRARREQDKHEKQEAKQAEKEGKSYTRPSEITEEKRSVFHGAGRAAMNQRRQKLARGKGMRAQYNRARIDGLDRSDRERERIRMENRRAEVMKENKNKLADDLENINDILTEGHENEEELEEMLKAMREGSDSAKKQFENYKKAERQREEREKMGGGRKGKK